MRAYRFPASSHCSFHLDVLPRRCPHVTTYLPMTPISWSSPRSLPLSCQLVYRNMSIKPLIGAKAKLILALLKPNQRWGTRPLFSLILNIQVLCIYFTSGIVLRMSPLSWPLLLTFTQHHQPPPRLPASGLVSSGLSSSEDRLRNQTEFGS